VFLHEHIVFPCIVLAPLPDGTFLCGVHEAAGPTLERVGKLPRVLQRPYHSGRSRHVIIKINIHTKLDIRTHMKFNIAINMCSSSDIFIMLFT